jgi:hypothetical protein
MRLPALTVIRDTREQKGWDFHPEEKVAGKIQVLGTEVGTLEAGDYSLKGYEDIIRIERKMGFRELFGNYSPVANRERFEREMEKLRHIKYKYIIVESSLSDDLLGMAPPQVQTGLPCNTVMKWLEELEVEYGISVKYAGPCGKRLARTIFEAVARAENGK